MPKVPSSIPFLLCSVNLINMISTGRAGVMEVEAPLAESRSQGRLLTGYRNREGKGALPGKEF